MSNSFTFSESKAPELPSEIEALLKQKRKIDNRIKIQKNKANSERRKKDANLKILLGAGVIALKDDEVLNKVVKALKPADRGRVRALFEQLGGIAMKTGDDL